MDYTIIKSPLKRGTEKFDKHPEWGQTNTWEWFADKYGDDGRLIGGRSGDGGLARVGCVWSGYRRGGLGFSPVVPFPSKTR